jgi:2-aminoadipate transaminase
MPEAVSWNSPRGGFFLWLRVPDTIDSQEMLTDAVKSGVAYVPGESFCVDGSGKNAMRLCYSKESRERLQQGVALLAETIKSKL